MKPFCQLATTALYIMSSLTFAWKMSLPSNILIYTGSHVYPNRCNRLVNALNNRLNSTVQIDVSTSYNPLRRFPKKTVLIGHSFGGTFALLDQAKENVEGVVLLNSHWNQRLSMPYPGLRVKDKNTLCILGSKDDKLPLEKAITDLQVVHENGFRNVLFSVFSDMDHMSGTNIHAKGVVDDIMSFITCTRADLPQTDFQNLFKRPIEIPSCKDYSQTTSLLDALWKEIAPTWVWSSSHFTQFLMSKPEENFNYCFLTHDAFFVKCYNVIPNALRTHNTNVKWITLPPTSASMMKWLNYQPKVNYKNNKIEIEMI